MLPKKKKKTKIFSGLKDVKIVIIICHYMLNVVQLDIDIAKAGWIIFDITMLGYGWP